MKGLFQCPPRAMPWAKSFWAFSPFQPYCSLFFSLNDLFSPLQRLADMISDVLLA